MAEDWAVMVANDGYGVYVREKGLFKRSMIILKTSTSWLREIRNIYMEHLFEGTGVQYLLRGAGVDFLACVDGKDSVAVM